jgi:hypothetical protein
LRSGASSPHGCEQPREQDRGVSADGWTVEPIRVRIKDATFKSYNSDDSGTLLASQKETHPFVRKLFAGR